MSANPSESNTLNNDGVPGNQKTVAQLMESIGAQRVINLALEQHADTQVPGAIRFSSNLVQPGDIFCCIVGTKVDGHTFAQDAANRGASALLVERFQEGVACDQYLVADTRVGMASLAAAFYDNPSRAMQVVGITGTNGKTTISSLVTWIASYAGKTCATIGTLGAEIAGVHVPTNNTTPESVDFQELLARARDAQCDVVACEVSSHALALERVRGTAFAVTAFSQLSQDHLDYHDSMEEYFLAKTRLFLDYPSDTRVICIEDAWGKQLLDMCEKAHLTTLSVGRTPHANINVVSQDHSASGTQLTLSTPEGLHELTTPLIGGFNIQNTLIACGIARSLGFSWDTIRDALAVAPQVPGRLERVSDMSPVAVYVDYAHTPDALEKAMDAVRETNPSRLVTVFGCGGDRDTTKRAPMGRIGAQADIAIPTSDNPRTEDPEAILNMVMQGVDEAAPACGCTVHRVVDRVEAIREAVALAQPGDAILISGKGHEDYQIIGTTKHHLDDREEARRALADAGYITL